MPESKFYQILDAMGEVHLQTDGFYPELRDLNEARILAAPERYVPILAYFASDPFKRMRDPSISEEEYQEIVERCAKILAKIPLIEDA